MKSGTSFEGPFPLMKGKPHFHVQPPSLYSAVGWSGADSSTFTFQRVTHERTSFSFHVWVEFHISFIPDLTHTCDLASSEALITANSHKCYLNNCTTISNVWVRCLWNSDGKPKGSVLQRSHPLCPWPSLSLGK